MKRRVTDDTNEREREPVWRPPTRRAFVAMLGAAAAAFALADKRPAVDPEPPARPKGMRWIGHC